MTRRALLMFVAACAGAPALGIVPPDQDFTARELLARPTDRSVTIKALGARLLDVYAEWGAAPGVYDRATPPERVGPGVPIQIVIDGLRPDTPYYYRLRWRRPDGASVPPEAGGDTTGFEAGPERAFHTRRLPGSAFRFVVQADPHLDDNSGAAVYRQTLLNELADRPDFMFDLGDTSMVDKCAIDGEVLCAPPSPASFESVWERNALMRSYFDVACHSVPLFMVLGNHDGEHGWQGELTANSLAGWSVAARKALYANPEPDDVYYYAFEWGDALFVVLDPFTYTTRKPNRNQDSWAWTLGDAQYRWLVRTLEASRARFKFVFSHHLVGGNGSEARGGAAFARFFEWGGHNLDGSWAFDERRPGWPAPIHQLLVDHGVTAWFHGHDHLYAREELDGVVYQAVPQPSLSRYDNPSPGAGYGYLGSAGVNLFPSSGHLRVTVSATEVHVEYVRSVAGADETPTRRNGSIVHSYVVR